LLVMAFRIVPFFFPRPQSFSTLLSIYTRRTPVLTRVHEERSTPFGSPCQQQQSPLSKRPSLRTETFPPCIATLSSLSSFVLFLFSRSAKNGAGFSFFFFQTFCPKFFFISVCCQIVRVVMSPDLALSYSVMSFPRLDSSPPFRQRAARRHLFFFLELIKCLSPRPGPRAFRLDFASHEDNLFSPVIR